MPTNIHADTPVPFGYKCSWLAIRTSQPEQVVARLHLVDTHPSAWHTGIEAAYRGNCFVTPPIQDWVLVVSFDLPWPERNAPSDRCTRLLLNLGQQFPDVQFFATHRVVEFHAWARVVDGVLVRQYAYSGEGGEVIWNTGEETREEVALRLVQAQELSDWEDEEDEEGDHESVMTTFMPSEEDVMHMAATWSIDPTKLDSRGLARSSGYLGAFQARQ